MTANRGPGVAVNAGVGTTTLEHRLQLAGQYAENAPGVPRSGVLSQAAAQLVTAKATMAYDIGPAQLVISRTAGEGVYTPTLTGTTTVATTAAPASNSRWDLIWVKQNDVAKGDADNLAVTGVVQGASGATPTKPYASVPAGAYVLAEAQIFAGTTGTSGGTNTLTQVWRHTASRGARFAVRNLTERAEITSPALGQEICRLDRPGGPTETYTGTAWVDVPGALGRLAESVQPSSFDGFSGGEFFADSIPTVDLKKGRKYRIDYRFSLVAPTGASIAAVFNFKKSLTTDTGPTGSTIESQVVWSPPVANSGGFYNQSCTYTPAADETVRLLITSGRIAGSSLYNLSTRTLTVTDEGAQF